MPGPGRHRRQGRTFGTSVSRLTSLMMTGVSRRIHALVVSAVDAVDAPEVSTAVWSSRPAPRQSDVDHAAHVVDHFAGGTMGRAPTADLGR